MPRPPNSPRGRFDELAVVGLLDVVGTHPLEHFTEQIELVVRV
jgi:hypothetical protein